MSDQMTRIQQEAEQRARDLNVPDIGYEAGYEGGFTAGRTISLEQFYRAAWAVRGSSESTLDQIQADLRIALEAAGLVIEE